MQSSQASKQIEQVHDSIYSIRIPLPDNPLKSLNAYVIRGERNLLVDTGFRHPVCREALLQGLGSLGISMEQTDIFLTHLHSDHTGLAPELASEQTRIYIGQRELRLMPGMRSTISWVDYDRHYEAEGYPKDLLQRLTTENPAQSFAPVPFTGYLAVENGAVLEYGGYRFRAMLTPGHTPGHMILWDETTGTALLGDHVLFDITPNISRWLGFDDALGAYLQSLRQVRELPVKVPLPAHRAVHMDFRERCDALIEHHSRRCGEVLHILSDGVPKTTWSIAAQMTWRIRAKSWEDFPAPQKWFAGGEAMAHLDHLIAQGLVCAEQKEDGLVYYRLQQTM